MTRPEEVQESAGIVLDALHDAEELLRRVRPLLDQVRLAPGCVNDGVMCDLYAQSDTLYQEVNHAYSALKQQVLNSAQFGPVTTSDGSRGWTATRLGHPLAGPTAYRLDPLRSDELGELT